MAGELARPAKPRPLWLTLPSYAVAVVVIVLDIAALRFWARVGGPLGTRVSLVTGAVIVVTLLLLALDVRRQLLLRRESAG